MKAMKHTLFLIISCPALLAGCSLFSNYERPKELGISVDSLYRDTTDVYATINADTTNYGNTPWEQVFTDPHLQTLIRKALVQNTDMRTADLTIQQAEAQLQTSRLAFYPTISFNPQGNISSFDFGKATKTYSVPINASWQIDAFGQLRNTKKQSQVALEQYKAVKQATRTSIIASVANMYYTLQMLDEQLKTTEETVKLWQENVRAMEAMKVGGMTNEAAVAQTKANYYELLTTVPTLKSNIKQTENSLCLLLHEAPHPIERGTFNADAFPKEYATGVPLQLLANRPDVRSAELQLASAFYGINLAKGAFYPSITLSGSAGWTNNAGVIVNPGKILASAVASLVQPIFQNGKLRANLKISKLQYESAQLQFEKALLSAGNEVSNALTSYQAAAQQEVNRKVEVENLEKALFHTQQLFKLSTGTTYLETLTAQQSLLQAQLSLISDKFDKVQAAISLYQALGGGRETTGETRHTIRHSQYQALEDGPETEEGNETTLRN